MHQAGSIRVDDCGCEKEHIELDIEIDPSEICEIQKEIPVLIEYNTEPDEEVKKLETTIPLVIETDEPIVCDNVVMTPEPGVYIMFSGKTVRVGQRP